MTRHRRPQGAECQCPTCDEIFTSETGFTRHMARRGPGGTCIWPGTQTDTKGRPLYRRHMTKRGPVWKLRNTNPYAAK